MYKSNNKMYSTFTKVFRLVLDKHAPVKVKKSKRKPKSLYDKEI